MSLETPVPGRPDVMDPTTNTKPLTISRTGTRRPSRTDPSESHNKPPGTGLTQPDPRRRRLRWGNKIYFGSVTTPSFIGVTVEVSFDLTIPSEPLLGSPSPVGKPPPRKLPHPYQVVVPVGPSPVVSVETRTDDSTPPPPVGDPAQDSRTSGPRPPPRPVPRPHGTTKGPTGSGPDGKRSTR